MDHAQLSNRFRTFAIQECHNSSKLYECLAMQVAEDEEILELCSHANPGQPVPNLLFGAAHYLLLKGSNHPLKDYYPSLTSISHEAKDVFPHFKQFCRIHDEEIKYLLANKLVQTNEVRRCAYLYPVFCMIYKQWRKPFVINRTWQQCRPSINMGSLCLFVW